LFYLDDGPPHSFLEMIEAAERAMDRRARLRIPLPRPVTLGAAFATELFGKVTNRAVIFTRDKCNELFEQWVSDSTEARKQLGWQPRLRFDEGIKLTIDWYREHGWL
jgi:nucleoside-diphosphate-sugar epimerase